MGLYIRFGDLPENNRSECHAELIDYIPELQDACGQDEKNEVLENCNTLVRFEGSKQMYPGVCALFCEEVDDGEFEFETTGYHADEFEQEFGDRPCYLVEGRKIGEGWGGEPVIVDPVIVATCRMDWDRMVAIRD